MKQLMIDVKKISKSSLGKLVFSAALMLSFLAIPFTVFAGYFPDRPTFNYNKGDDNQDCSNPNHPSRKQGRCGSFNGPVFNSFINTPSYGDERAFFDARMSENVNGKPQDILRNIDQGSRKVVMRIYVHNNAHHSTNASGKGVAKGTRVKVELPANKGTSLRSVAAISANNSVPREVVDTVDLRSNERVGITYEPGSAFLYNNGAFKNGVKLDDAIVTTGAPIGYDALDGQVPGCFKYEAVIEMTVTVIPEQKPLPPPPVQPTAQPSIKIAKQVRMHGQQAWQEEVSAKPGDTVQWLITAHNNGQTQLTNMVARDALPSHLQVVPGTVKTFTATEDPSTISQTLITSGENIGSSSSNSIRHVMFDTKVLDNFSECQKQVVNTAFLKSDQTPNEISDTASLILNRDCQVAPSVTKELPATGAGGMVATFVMLALATAAGHFVFSLRPRN